MLAALPGLALIDELAALEPFGRQWESPVFRADGRVLDLRAVGDGTHLKLTVGMASHRFEAIWFGAVRDGVRPVEIGQQVRMAFELDANTFRDETRLQLRIRHAVAIA